METEKITINIGAIDLGHIDLLVEQGFYTNRTDFIRTAIRNQLTAQSADIYNIKASGIPGLNIVKEIDEIGNDINNSLIQSISGSTTGFSGGTGVFIYNRKNLEAVKASGEKIKLVLVGMLIIEKDVTAELIKETFEKVKVYGIIKANEEVKRILLSLK